jgi:hypothetical protein
VSGCLHLFGPYYYFYDVTITLQDGVPCFSFNTEVLPNEKVSIDSVYMEVLASQGAGKMWEQRWETMKPMKPGECIPYGGDAEIKINTLYMIGFSADVEESTPMDNYGYDAFFCLTKNQDGQTVLHQWSTREAPAACPAN